MRIGMMADVYKPHISGITNYIELNKRHLEKAGHEVFVFTFGDENYQDDEPNIVHSAGLPLVDTGYYLSFQYNREAKAVLQSMDVVHVHHPFLSGRLALRYCPPLNIPIVFTNHTRYDLYAQAYLPGIPSGISRGFLENYMPDFCSAVDMVVSPSAGMERVLRKFKVDVAIEIIPNGVDIQRFLNIANPLGRAELGLTASEVLLVYVGRLAPEKNLLFLLKAFTGVAEALEHTHLLLIGTGPDREKLEEQIARAGLSGRVHFSGQVQYDQLPAFLSMCDIFVTASVSEVHPLSVIEAMAASLPVVGIHSVGVGDIVRDEVTGLLARDDPAAFAAKLTRLCLNAELRQEMGRAGRKESEKYAIEQTSAVMISHYERLSVEGKARKHGLSFRLRSFLETPRE
jgi:1,2-diacylglycerol 3-alpha-glucosyltransferase